MSEGIRIHIPGSLGPTLAEDGELDANVTHMQSAERVRELEESVWSVVREENEREEQGECVHVEQW